MSKLSQTKKIVENATKEKNKEEIDPVLMNRVYDLHDKMEREKEKDEQTKQHERHLRYIKDKSSPTKLEVRPAKREKFIPGIDFIGPLKVLIERFKTIDEIFKHMTVGQLAKYYEMNGEVYRIYKDGRPDKLVFNANTGEVFDE